MTCLAIVLALVAPRIVVCQSIVEKTQSVDMPDFFYPTPRFTTRLNGLCGQTCRNGPSQMYTTSFDNTLLVAWNSIDPTDMWRSEGHVASFTVSDGEFHFVSDVKFPICHKMAGMTSNPDGSIIAVLCKGFVDAPDPPGTISFIDKRKNDNDCTDWTGACYPTGWYSDLDAPLYLFEYTSGSVTSASPDRTVLINHAVGGSNYGHQVISINQAEDTYFVDLKVTLGPSATNRHQGQVHFGIKRDDMTWIGTFTDGFACGGGHTIANRLTYNEALDTWSRLCMIDSFHEARWATTPTPPNSEASLLIPEGGGTYAYGGGIMNAVSLGQDGWMACGLGPDRLSYTGPGNSTIGVIKLPKTHLEFAEDHKPRNNTGVHDPAQCRENGVLDDDCCAAPDASSCANGHQFYYTGVNCQSHYQVYECWVPDPSNEVHYQYDWNWLDIPSKNTSAKAARAGMVNLANFGLGGENSGKLLIGWSPAMAQQGIADEYLVSELSTDGQLVGTPLQISSGWGEDNEWQYMAKTGCVVFPFVWMGDSGPGQNFPVEGVETTTKTMQLTSLCPYTPPTPPTPPTNPPSQPVYAPTDVVRLSGVGVSRALLGSVVAVLVHVMYATKLC